jgi:hypothetical protein
MQTTTIKTGLARRIREEMRQWTRPRSKSRLCRDLEMEHGADRQAVSSALQDFEGRGEIVRTGKGYLAYNHAWRRADKAPLKEKILRAMYVQGGVFASTDIRRLVPDAEKSHVEKTLKALLAAGHIAVMGRRLCAHGPGVERIYALADRTRFRMEVMR